jgi:hypothetical protein
MIKATHTQVRELLKVAKTLVIYLLITVIGILIF